MKNLVFTVFLLLFCFTLYAQQNHFIYLQTEDKKPFFVRLDNKTYSSSANGYLIIPKLQDGQYRLIIGFPKNTYPEQTIVCTVDNKDAGYMVRNFDDKGWGLMNLSNFNVTMVGDVAVKKPEPVKENKDDAFSNMLSKVVNDSSIRQKEVTREDVTPQAPEKKETAVAVQDNKIVNNEPVQEEKKEVKPPAAEVTKDVATVTPEEKKVAGTDTVASKDVTTDTAEQGKITRNLMKNSKDGMEMMYVDKKGNVIDTVRVFIPSDKKDKKKKDKEQAENVQEAKPQPKFIDLPADSSKSAPPEIVPEAKKEPVKEDTPPVVTKADVVVKQENTVNIPPVVNKPDVQSTTTEGNVSPVVSGSQMVNSDCKTYATDDDFLKLRRKMTAASNDDDMIGIAKKVFKTRCFTAEQVKNLGVLFLKDEGRYMFYEAAYPHVIDTERFAGLSGQFSDSYYINRFKAMIRH